MTNKDDFYMCMVEKLKGNKEEEFLRNKVMIRLIQDVYHGYNRYDVINQVLCCCDVNRQTWENYLFAFSLYKTYECNGEYEKVKMN